MSATDLLGKSLVEIEKLLDSPLSVDGFSFFLGLIVVDLVINGLLYWDHSISHCRVTSDGICKKSLKVFQRIVFATFYVFAIILGIKIVGGGIRGHKSLNGKTFLPLLAFVIAVALFKWLFTDVFQVMYSNEDFTGPNTLEGSTVLKAEFYRVVDQFDYTTQYGFGGGTILYILLGGLVYGLV